MLHAPLCQNAEYELELQRWNQSLEVSGSVGLILYDPKGFRDL